MTSLLGDKYLHWIGHEFAELRDLADSRITLFNARRDGDNKLTMSNWYDARDNAWLNMDRLHGMDTVEKENYSKT